MSRTLASTLALSLLFTSAVRAQESTTRGFNLEIHLSGASLTVDDERSNAAGGGIWIGYGFNPTVQLFVQLDGAEFDVQDADVEGVWTMAHGDVGVRFHFADALRTWVPYLQVALSGRAVSVEDAVVLGAPRPDVSWTGGALSLGGGILFYFNETLAADLQLLWSGGEFDRVESGAVTVQLPDPIEAQSARFNIGVSWWP
jgi:hypothetical protein